MQKYFVVFSLFFILDFSFAQNRVVVNPIICDSNFDSLSFEKLKTAVIILENIINSKDFEHEIRKTHFRVGSKNLSSREIYDLIISGKNSTRDTLKDYSIDLRLKIFDNYRGQNNFGITDMNSRVTRTHRCFILNNSVECFASHLAHEYMHQIGFYDKRTWLFGTKTKSVPYKVGNIVKKLSGNNSFCAAQKINCGSK